MLVIQILICLHFLIPCVLLLLTTNKLHPKVTAPSSFPIYFFFLFSMFFLYLIAFRSYGFSIVLKSGSSNIFIFEMFPVLCILILFLIVVLSLYVVRPSICNYFLFFTSILSGFCILAVSSCHLTNFYLLLESISLVVFVLIRLSSNSLISVYAALKYITINLVSSSVFLLGCFCFFLCWGSLDCQLISLLEGYASYSDDLYLLDKCGVFFTISSFLIKLGVFPFHNWLLDIYDGLNNYALFTINCLSKPVMLLMLFNLYSYTHPSLSFIRYLVFFCGVASLIFSSIFLFLEKNIRRFLGILGILSSGFFLFLLDSFSPFVNIVILFYLFAQSIQVLHLLLFLSLKNQFIEVTEDLTEQLNLIELNFSLSVFLFVLICSYIGLPPFLGFLPKICFFLHLLQSQKFLLLSFLLLISIFNAVCFFFILIPFYTSKPSYFRQVVICVNLKAFVRLSYFLSTFHILAGYLCFFIISDHASYIFLIC